MPLSLNCIFAFTAREGIDLNGRGTTNFLLAVIAAALLFGGATVLGAAKYAFIGLAILMVVIGAIWLVYFGIYQIIKALLDAYSKNWTEFILTLCGFIIILNYSVLCLYAGYLWVNGDNKAINTALDSRVSYINLWVLGFLFIFLLLNWLIKVWADIPAALLYFTTLIAKAPFAVLLLPRYGWNKARQSGDGLISSFATSVLGFVFGSLITGLSLAAIYQLTFWGFSQ